MQKRLLSLALSLSLVLSGMPTAALAEALDAVAEGEATQDVVEEAEQSADFEAPVDEELTDEETVDDETPAPEDTQEVIPAEEERLPEPEEAAEGLPVETQEDAGDSELAAEEPVVPEVTDEEPVAEAPTGETPTTEAPADAEPELTAQATLPKMSAAITEANALAILKAYDPDGYTMVSFTKTSGSANVSLWLKGHESNADGLDTVVHEECHGYSHDRPNGWNEEAIYTGSGNYITVNMDAPVTIFPTSEMASKIPSSLRTMRYDTYASTSSNASSNLNGPYGLLNEFNAYSWGLNNQLKLFPYYRDYASSTNPLDAFSGFLSNCMNNKNAYAEFRYWTLRYLWYAKTKHPDVYEHFMSDQQFLDAYCQTQRRFEGLIAQIDQRVNDIVAWGKKQGYTVWVENGMLWAGKNGSSNARGTSADDYDLLMAEIAKPEYQEIDQAIQSKAQVYSISKAKVASVAAKPYSGSAYRPKPKVTYGGKTLKNGTDYTLSYKNNVNAGTATITLTGKGNYFGTKKVTFKITPLALGGATVSQTANQKYDGKTKKPSPKVVLDGKTLKKGTDYSLTYAKNTKPGTATITITGMGNYSGTKKTTFRIVVMAGAWKKSGSRWWYRWKDGTYPASVWLIIGGKTYRFDAVGWKLTGWQQVSGKWYWLGSDGAMRTGWLSQGGKRYWLKSSGAMATGWLEISGKWYYFESSGAMVRSKWQGNYYLQADGTMAVSTWIGKYHVDATGKWDKTR